mmetsp:Transcript_37522/g.91017  ORF Transcript_37522/g.91017 Transcript_37522/m.91017 type:complete len:205 (+) Transcript_37522:156-770(+)
MQHETRGTNQIAKQYGMRSKDSSSKTIQPNPSAHKQVPSQDVTPFFCYKVGVVGDHVHECCLRITTGVKYIIEFRQRGSASWLDNRTCHNEKVRQCKKGDHIKASHDFLGNSGIGQQNQEHPKRLWTKGCKTECSVDWFGRCSNNFHHRVKFGARFLPIAVNFGLLGNCQWRELTSWNDDSSAWTTNSRVRWRECRAGTQGRND